MLPDIPPDISPWFYYFAVGAGVLVVGIAKGGFGGGIGILAVPLLALAMKPMHMLGVMLPLLIVCDIFSNLHYIGEYEWKHLRRLVPGAAIGIGVGTAVLFYMREMPPAQFNQVMNLMIGVMCLLVVGMQVWRMMGKEIPTLPPHPASAVGVGVVAGAASTLNHSAGPIVMVYLLQEKLPKRPFVATMLMYFLIGNTLKLPTFLLLPMADGKPFINAQTLHDSIWFIPLIPVGTMLGAWMNKRIPEKPFAAIMYVAAAAAAVQLIAKALMHHPVH